MIIKAQGLAKRFNADWIFREVNYQFESGQHYAIIGHNGSGKSTLLQLLAGIGLPTKGNVEYTHREKTIDPDLFFRHIAMVAPYLELVEELNLKEFLDFHFTFKTIKSKKNQQMIMESAGLLHSYGKPLKFFSSGMKQRLQLALAFMSDVDVILLDEPTSNLDAQGVLWYQELIKSAQDQLVIIASNQVHEYEHCNKVLNMLQWK